ncbi:AI-2E family transporter [Anaerobacillus sp. HL2]|nr:AI-2E family transporter [Anaerobacillus sp. HL2]
MDIGAFPVTTIAFTESTHLVLLGLMVSFGLPACGRKYSFSSYCREKSSHPVLIILSLIIGAEVGGIVGLILAVPTLAILKVLVMHTRESLHKQSEMKEKF